ncbi:MAG: patatin-like phospholipase family protein [archaeon]
MKIGLVLSGGGARGLAHIGVLKIIDKHKIPISAIAGSSMGSIIGTLYASGLSALKIEDIMNGFRKRDFYHVLDFALSSQGLVRGEKAINYVLRFIRHKKIENLKIPLAINSTDLLAGKEVVFRKGNIFEALCASTSFPGAIIPKKKRNTFLLDGGLVNPLALGLLNENKIDFSIVVNVSTGFGKNINRKNPNVLDIFKQGVNIMQDELISLKLKTTPEDIVLIKPKVEKFDIWDMTNSNEIIKRGETGAKRVVKTIKEKIKYYLEQQSL